MAGLFREGAALLARVRGASLAEPLVYRRRSNGAEVSVSGTASPPAAEETDAERLVSLVRRMHFLIAAADLQIGGERFEPGDGDEIVRTGQNATGAPRTYRVAGEPGQPPFRESDPFGITLRVHTVEASS